MKRFFNEDMKANQNISAQDAVKLKAAFKNAIQIIKSLLGSQYAFKALLRG
jgi:hypothetical protein